MTHEAEKKFMDEAWRELPAGDVTDFVLIGPYFRLLPVGRRAKTS
jgi:hypothetical protein